MTKRPAEQPDRIRSKKKDKHSELGKNAAAAKNMSWLASKQSRVHLGTQQPAGVRKSRAGKSSEQKTAAQPKQAYKDLTAQATSDLPEDGPCSSKHLHKLKQQQAANAASQEVRSKSKENGEAQKDKSTEPLNSGTRPGSEQRGGTPGAVSGLQESAETRSRSKRQAARNGIKAPHRATATNGVLTCSLRNRLFA